MKHSNQSECIALTNGRVILPDRIEQGKALLVTGSTIRALIPQAQLPSPCQCLDMQGAYIAPGLIDIHIHGAAGQSFNDPREEAYSTIVKENARRGITALLATLATAPLPDLVATLAFCRQWCSTAHAGAQVLGVHLEGPYFSPAFCGAQDPQALRTPDDGSAEDLLAFHDVLRIMSYAPELPGACELTTRLIELGIVPAAGHSAARDQDVWAVRDRGLKHVIHIWSAQSTVIKEGPWRKPGLLEATLASADLTGEIIADNKHLPATLMQIAYRCLGPDRLCIISDAISGAGLADGSYYVMGNMRYQVRSGVGMLLDGSAFAGSTTLLNEMLPILIDSVGIGVAEAVRMASLTPARVIGVEQSKGSITPGKDADIVIFDDRFQALRTMIHGSWLDEYS